MFLHAGASLHGHEYSNRYAAVPPVHPHNLRSPLLRSAFATPKSHLAAKSDEARPPALRRRPVSDYIPRSAEPVVRFKEPEPEPEPQNDHDPELTSIASRQPQQMASTQQKARSLSMNDDSGLSESEFSDATQSTGTSPALAQTRRKRRRAPRKTTTYHLGYPTPKLLAKKKVLQKVLPRLVLQLQLVCDNGRSKPVLEVFPATHLVGPVIAHRMAKRFPAIFKAKHQLCYDDLVLVKRDDRKSSADGLESGDEEGGLEDRKLLAVYSPLKNTQTAELVLDDGTTWVATPLRNGSFDYVNVDEQGNQTTARWARRAMASSTSSEPALNMGTSAPEPRFTFSIINPLTRRHPVLATLTKTSLNVQDTYTSVTSSHGRYPPSRPLSRTVSMYETPRADRTTSSVKVRSMSGSEDEDSAFAVKEPETERTVHVVDDSMKLLISVTGLWVALSSGWSDNYTPSNSTSTTREATAEPTGPLTPAASSVRSSRRNTWNRNNSNPPIDSPAAVPPTNKRNSNPLVNSRSVSPAPRATSTPSPVPRRATSTGAAFMQRRIEREKSQSRDGMPLEDSELGSFHRRAVSTGYTFSPQPRSDYVYEEAVSPRAIGAEGLVSTTTPQPAVQEQKTGGVRARFTRWFHKLGGR